MARLRIETAPEITVFDEAFVIKAAANATAPLVQLKDSSGTVVGNITSNGTLNVQSVVAANAGTSSTDLATRAYVDSLAAGTNWHAAVVYATVEALPACTYNNGTNGVGATLTANAYGTLQIDGENPLVTYSVLIKDQADARQNGIYSVTNTGGPSAYFILTRRTDADNSPAGEVKPGDAVYVIDGTASIGNSYVITSTGTGTGGQIDIGVDNIVYSLFAGTAATQAGAGLVRDGYVLNVATADLGRIVVNANNIDLATINVSTSGGSNTTSFIDNINVDSYGRVTSYRTASVSFTGYALSANSALTGTPTAPTANAGSNSTQIATTEFVEARALVAEGNAANSAANIFIQKASFDAKGDILVGLSDNTLTRQPVGSNGQYIAANSSTSSGIEWKTLSLAIDDLSDVTVSSAATGQLVRYNGSAWVNANLSPTITLGGDLTGNVTLTNLADGTLTATIAANSVALGTDTTGNYVSDVSSGTGITVTHTPGEGSTASIAINTSVTADLTTAQTLSNKTLASAVLTTEATTSSSSFNLINTTATTVNFAGAATALAVGAATGNTSVKNNLIVEGSSITTTSATFGLVNTNVTTLNFAGAATTLTVGNTSGNTTLNGNVVIGGSLTVNGANTIINANTLVVADKNIQMANLEVQTNTTADGGGILLHGATDKTFYWYDASSSWTSSEHLDLASGKVYKINNTTVLSGTTLGSGVTGSSLTSFGTSPALTTPTISSGGATFNGSTSGTTILRANATASGTITLPGVTGTVITTGDTGTVTGTMIADNTIVNAEIATTAAIAYSKLNLATSIVNADISATAAIDQNKIADTVINPQTTSYTLVLTDKNKQVEISNASATTLTIPADNTVNMATGASIVILQTGAGQVTIAGAAGVTVNATPGLKLRTTWSSATLIKRAANTWVALGDLSA